MGLEHKNYTTKELDDILSQYGISVDEESNSVELNSKLKDEREIDDEESD